ncbi:uncharacterized protein TNCV_2751241 [Trichonephila clavipes]|nr:uncharacterized protein TNCV_2751241 [Trichonephila clavipes]
MDGMQMYTVLSQEKTTSPYFQGVYSRDTLPPLQENMCAIVNSDDSSQPGTPWSALFVNDKRELEFYDSFGQPPVFYNISTTTYLDVLWNSKVFQSPTSNFDGLEQVGLGTDHIALSVIAHCWDSGLRRQWVCSLNGLDETPLFIF